MDKTDVSKLQKGDIVSLKHNLGRGPITQILMEWYEGCGQPRECRYPMIEYCQEVTHNLCWCTYRVVDHAHRLKPVGKLRSIT